MVSTVRQRQLNSLDALNPKPTETELSHPRRLAACGGSPLLLCAASLRSSAIREVQEAGSRGRGAASRRRKDVLSNLRRIVAEGTSARSAGREGIRQMRHDRNRLLLLLLLLLLSLRFLLFPGSIYRWAILAWVGQAGRNGGGERDSRIMLCTTQVPQNTAKAASEFRVWRTGQQARFVCEYGWVDSRPDRSLGGDGFRAKNSNSTHLYL